MHEFLERIKWKTLLSLIIVAVAVIFNLNWIWGVLFLFWVIPSLIMRETHFIEVIRRDENPVYYWIIIVMWLVLSLYLILEPLLWR